MMFGNLEAAEFKYNTIIYNSEFEDILSKIIICYDLMIRDKVSLCNNENDIRDVLMIKYLKNKSIRQNIKLTNYLFDREVPEDKSIGRTDIKIQTLNTFEDVEAYYIIECKRLDKKNPDGISGLNAKYIENGICRFTSETYSSFYKTNGMIGFIVEQMNISENITSINNLLALNFPKINTTQELQYREIYKDFNFSYCSCHKNIDKQIVIYHLMFDFSKNINHESN